MMCLAFLVVAFGALSLFAAAMAMHHCRVLKRGSAS